MHSTPAASSSTALERWPLTGLSTRAWLQLEPCLLPISALHAVQDVVDAEVWAHMTAPNASYCGDPLIHVIDWSGRWWVEDGHHRLRAAVRRGCDHVWCRVWPPPIRM